MSHFQGGQITFTNAPGIWLKLNQKLALDEKQSGKNARKENCPRVQYLDFKALLRRASHD
jgi:hypothetical protein